MIRAARADEAGALHELAAQTFPLATTPGTDPADIAAFIAQNLSLAAFERYLADPDRILLVADADDGIPGAGLLGYAMVVLGVPYDEDVRAAIAARYPVAPAGCAELSKLYVRVAEHGAGVAAALLDASLAAAADRGAEALWLGVNRHNPRAVRFYEKQGLERIGQKRFRIGDRPELDLVYGTRLPPPVE